MSCSASPKFLEKWSYCIESQKKYCKKNGYDYSLAKGNWPEKSKKWTWNKHFVLNNFEQDYDVFIGIDADIEIKENCPPIETVLNDSSIYYVNGISGRPNAGFLIYRNDSIRKYFHSELLKRKNLTVPKKFKVKPGGENGHVVWILSEMKNGIQELPLKWNCSQPEYADDAFVLHYTNKLKSHYNHKI